jgi:hypothetical protein
MSIQQQSLPFCGLNLKMYSTGKQSPSFEYQASSTKAKFQCSITKKLYDLTEVPQWINSPEVQRYVQAGYVLKWGSKIQQGKASQYSNGMELAITCYMIKPFNKSGYGNNQPKQQGYKQSDYNHQLSDDKLPESPRQEIEWATENATDFNPNLYEQELD